MAVPPFNRDASPDPADSGERFPRELLEVIPCAVFLVGGDGRINYWNRSAEQMTGYAAEEMLGQTCDTLSVQLRSNVDPDVAASLCPFQAGPDAWDEQCEIRRKDGTTFQAVRKARPLHDEAGEVVGGVQAIMDVSSIRRASEEIARLREEVARLGRYGKLIGSSPEMRKLYEAIETVAPTDASVVIEGETGTGKELIARTIHQQSSRREGPFVAVNCGALPEGLIEAELFGHVKGAFTGATSDRAGRFEAAAGGTLLLDELGELPAAAQVKLLRAVQEREISRVGESRTRTIDVRLLGATNRDLAADVADGRFREDLYYRLRVVGLAVPPLRNRRDDIPDLVTAFVERLNRRYQRRIQRCAPETLRRLCEFDWPGNVRQLEHALEHAFVVTPADAAEIPPEALPPELADSPGRPSHAPARDERQATLDALAQAQGNKTQAARLLGITRAGLYKRLKRFDLQ